MSDLKILEQTKASLLWKWFSKICEIPHPTFKEQALSDYVVNWAKSKNYYVGTDDVGNVLLRKPATKGYENKPSIALQAHFDMVTQANSDYPFDFDTQGIQMRVVDKDYIYATNTTLGADNGIGLASILAVFEAEHLQHPALEAILTTDEEVGMGGAWGLKKDWLESKFMINTDTEELGYVYMGCASGLDIEFDLPLTEEECSANCTDFINLKLSVAGFRGGHSGVEIHSNKENAIYAGVYVLQEIASKFDIKLQSIVGGSARNAIPREANFVFQVAKDLEEQVIAFYEQIKDTILATYYHSEPEAKYSLTKVESQVDNLAEKQCKHYTLADSKNIINFLACLPNGVQKNSTVVPGVVETSLSLGVIKIQAGAKKQPFVKILARTILEGAAHQLARKLGIIAEQFGYKVILGNATPVWEPTPSKFNEFIIKSYAEVYKEKPIVNNVIHAGLECGILKHHYPDMTITSIGPNIYYPHSPQENVQISSVDVYWDVLVNILEKMPDTNEL